MDQRGPWSFDLVAGRETALTRRPLKPLAGRPNPTDPGDAADLSIPQGYSVFMGRQFRESQPKARERSGLDPVYCLPNATACRLGRVPTLTQARVKSISKNHALHENACQSKVLTLSSEVRREHGALSCRGVNLAVFCGKGADPGRLPRVEPSRRPIRGTRVDAPRTCPASQGPSASLPSFPYPLSRAQAPAQ